MRLQCQVSHHRLSTLVRQGVNRKIVLRHLGRGGRQLQFLVYDVQRILLVHPFGLPEDPDGDLLGFQVVKSSRVIRLSDSAKKALDFAINLSLIHI